MISYFLLLVAIIFFVWGLIAIIKGWQGCAEDESVPISELEEMKEWTAGYPFERRMQEQEKKASPLPQEIETIKKEYERLRAEQESQMGDLKERLAQLNRDKEQLLLSREIVDELKAENQRLQEREDGHRSKIGRLEKEVSEAGQAALGHQSQFGEKIEQMQAENQHLLRGLKEKEEQLRQLMADLELTQKVNNQKLNEAQRAMDFLRIQKEESARMLEEALSKQLSEAAASIEHLKREKEEWVAVKAVLEEHLQKAETQNARLVERESALRHDLAKQRAQTLGLEKICEDFKIQIDEMSKSPKSFLIQ